MLPALHESLHTLPDFQIVDREQVSSANLTSRDIFYIRPDVDHKRW